MAAGKNRVVPVLPAFPEDTFAFLLQFPGTFFFTGRQIRRTAIRATVLPPLPAAVSTLTLHLLCHPQPSVPDSQGKRSFPLKILPPAGDAQSCRESLKHRAPRLRRPPQIPLGRLPGLVENTYLSVFQHTDPIRHGKEFFQTVFCENDRCSQFPVDSGKHLKKFSGCQRIQLTGRLVQKQHLRLHNHDRSQVQHLLLTARQLPRRLVIPALNTEKGRHLRHPPSHHLIRKAEIFQTKRQLVPDHIRHNGLRRILLYKSDLGRTGQVIHLGNLRSHICHAPGEIAAGDQILLHHPKQRALSAAGWPAD